MQMTLVKNPDTTGYMNLAHKVARVVYGQTGGISLPLVCAFTSMIKNLSDASGVAISKLISDKTIFPVLDDTNVFHLRMNVSAENRAFQMCVRTAYRMLMGQLPDSCYGATRFHYSDEIPGWATSRGYIADIDGMLFYL